MPTPTKGPRLGGGPAHERLILANLATSLFEHGRITTTEAKARRLRPLAERLISKAKRGDLHARRQVLSVIRDKSIVHELFSEIGPRYANRPGGYTRITKVGPRKGDNAPMAVIELVEALTVAQRAVGEAEGATRRSVKESGSSATKTDLVAQALAPAEALDAESPLASEPSAVEDAEAEAESEVETDAEQAADTSGDEASADSGAAPATESEAAAGPEAEGKADNAS